MQSCSSCPYTRRLQMQMLHKLIKALCYYLLYTFSMPNCIIYRSGLRWYIDSKMPTHCKLSKHVLRFVQNLIYARQSQPILRQSDFLIRMIFFYIFLFFIQEMPINKNICNVFHKENASIIQTMSYVFDQFVPQFMQFQPRCMQYFEFFVRNKFIPYTLIG